VDEDGTLSSVDPMTGEKSVLLSSSAIDEAESQSRFSGLTPEQRLDVLGRLLDETSASFRKKDADVELYPSSSGGSSDNSNRNSRGATTLMNMQLGDQIDVYIGAVFPQSGRFTVTLDPDMTGKKLRELKREKKEQKRLLRVAKKGVVGA